MTAARETLILTRRDISMLMDQPAWREAVETGFRSAAAGRAESPMPMHIGASGGAFHVKGARLDLDRSYVAVKLNGNFPDNPALRGLPTVQGALLLCDGANGAVLAIMDSIEITLRRTAAATAVAARFLARPDSHTVLICGCGEQGEAHLEALPDVLPLRRCFAWDCDPVRAEAFAGTSRLETEVVADLASAARESDVIVACTPSRQPYLHAGLVRPGTFVAAVGADAPEKSEIAPDLMASATVVADVLDQCAAMGDLHHALAAGAMRREDVHFELAQLVAGNRSGRTSAGEVTLFDSTGTALQDAASAAFIYRRAVGNPAILSVSLGAY